MDSEPPIPTTEVFAQRFVEIEGQALALSARTAQMVADIVSFRAKGDVRAIINCIDDANSLAIEKYDLEKKAYDFKRESTVALENMRSGFMAKDEAKLRELELLSSLKDKMSDYFGDTNSDDDNAFDLNELTPFMLKTLVNSLVTKTGYTVLIIDGRGQIKSQDIVDIQGQVEARYSRDYYENLQIDFEKTGLNLDDEMTRAQNQARNEIIEFQKEFDLYFEE